MKINWISPNPHGFSLRILKHLCCVTFQLMDMGFSREHALEALLNTSTMEQATEYLLTHPPPLSGAVRVRLHTENIR